MGEKKESPALVPPTSPLEESERIFELLQTGVESERNTQRLFELNYRKVYTFFLRRGFSPEESRELTQDVFFRLFKDVPSFPEEVRFGSLLFQISANLYRNELRQLRSKKRSSFEQSLDSPMDESSGDSNPLDELMEQERRERLRAALNELPPQMRRVCELRYVRGLKYQEIASVMHISIETVKAHLHQARKRLLLQLGDKSAEERGHA